MEMEKSSPLFVAQEFVRQYYSLLNNAPDVLHGSDSSYVHGGLDTNGNLAEPVNGQAGIHEKMVSLCECHTKIRHVDAHAMLNNGVVVQVLGELSNSGQPMRKFLQTFVLAPEGSDAKKYDIHNNIFCYVDEVFGDSDAEPKTQQTPKPRVGSKSKMQKAPLPPRAQHTDRRSFPPQRPRTGGRDGGPGDTDNRRIVRYPDSHQLFVRNLPHDTDESELKELFMTYGNVVELRINTRGRKLPKFAFVVFDNSDPVQNILQDEPILFRGEMRLHVAEKKTWAVREREQKMRLNNRGPRGSQGIVESGMMREHDGGRDGGPGDTDNRRIVRYPDSHQLFVRNLPHDTDESELKELFMAYGNVVELRINTRGRKLPKFAFVVFDNSDPVQNILQDEPIWFRGEVRLNVQKKKAWAVRERECREMR
ncbi:ras GTPase-activating protein-binding protein 2-like [Gouania willdenowi]|uniref:ras GTPase-activating protein-binding protein 2-like n=1 Tax=Gouania willdenowi TaxID=441366 RepID=UPI0010557FDD|nr:ras GTPase-activating protein-binding protein 2-like [Gouania willdenowi]XP_028293699.1 ras GTPase-activating protein-binding protein 2-like [Gouania willdenowi]